MTTLESSSSIFFSILLVTGFITRSHLLINSRPPKPSALLLLHREKESSLLAARRFVPDIEWTQHAVSALQSCAQLPTSPHTIEFITSGEATLRAGLSLRGVRAVGVDVEFSPKSYQGFVCSVQVSIPGGATDFVFDTLQVGVRNAIGKALGPIFSDANIPKVFHGAGSDIRWLSRDLGLTIIGLIDTAVLANAAVAPPSLAAALTARLGILLPDKAAGQRRDWRERPLPPSALEYAARDARHLIALAANFTAALSSDSLVRVCMKSALIATSPRDDEENNSTNSKHQQSAALQMQTIPGPPVALIALTNILASRDAMARVLDTAVDDIAPVALLASACMTGIRAALIENTGHAVRTAISSLSLSEAASTIVVREVLTSISNAVQSNLQPSSLLHHSLHQPAAAAVAAAAASLREAAKAARAERVFAPRATPLYSNCELLDPKGRVLARISKTKALWYINNGAGVAEPLTDTCGGGGGGGGGGGSISGGIIGEEGGATLRVRLLIAPRGPGHANDDFHLSPRVNECVVCSRPWKREEINNNNNTNDTTTTSGGLLRLYVIPRGVRCELPLSAKSYSSHDVVLVCIACHRRADSAAGSLLRRLAVALGRGAEGGETVDQIILRTLRSKALAVLKGRAPTLRLREYLLQLAKAENIDFAQRLKIALDTPHPTPATPISTSVSKPLPRGRSQRLPSNAAAVTTAAAFAREENTALAASWPLLTLGLDLGILTPDLIITLARAPNGAFSVSGGGEAEQPTTDISNFVVAAIYEGGAAWARGKYVLENGLREKVIVASEASSSSSSSSLRRGASGLLLTTEARLEILVRRFRQTFVEACVPRALPAFWSIDFPVFNAGTRTKEKKEAPLAIAALKAGL
jgi:ribonuclease D